MILESFNSIFIKKGGMKLGLYVYDIPFSILDVHGLYLVGFWKPRAFRAWSEEVVVLDILPVFSCLSRTLQGCLSLFKGGTKYKTTKHLEEEILIFDNTNNGFLIYRTILLFSD